MMEEYTDICSLLGLEDIDMKPPTLHDKQTIIEETLCDPSDLLDFLVSEQLRPSYSSLFSNLNIDINLNINDLSDRDRSGLAEDDRSGVSDLIDSESDSGVESINSVWPQDPSPPSSPSDHLSLSSIHAMLPLAPLPIRELTESSSLDAEEMLAVPPRLLIKQDKKPSLLSSILARPPLQTAASRQLSSLLTSPAPGSEEHNFSGFDSFKQKDNGRSDSTVKTLPTGQAERGYVREIPPRKKLIINKRKKEMIHMRESKKLHQDETPSSQLCIPWDGDLRSPLNDVIQLSSEPPAPPVFPKLRVSVVPQPQTQTAGVTTKFEKTFVCPTCDATFLTASARSCHRRHVHQRHHLCVTCDRAFTNKQKLERHLKIHRTEAKKLKSEKSRKEPEDRLNANHAPNTGKKRFECSSCPREYFTKSGLNHHLKQVHSTERLYKCSHCEFIGKTSLELENHCSVDHAQTISSTIDRNPPFTNSLEDCRQQQVVFDGQEEERVSVSFTNSTNRGNQCSHCGRKFAFKNSLTKHLSKGRCVILKKSQHQHQSF